MKKTLKSILCLLLMVAVPFSFVGCKKSQTEISSNQSNTDNSTPENNNNPPEQQQQYVIDNTEANEFLNDYAALFDGFVTSLNNSDLLENNSYSSGDATKTLTVLNYVYYPYLFAKNKPGNALQLDKICIYQGGGKENYFLLSKNDANNHFYVNFATNDEFSTFDYLFFDFTIDEGDITALDLAFVETSNTSNYIQFSQSHFDFDNLVIEISLGRIVYLSSENEENYMNREFTSEMFSLIDDWGYSLYEKFDFSATGSYTCVSKSNMSSTELNSKFSTFKFVDAFDKYDEFGEYSNYESITVDGLFNPDPNNTVFLKYTETNYIFEKVK